MQHFPWRAVVGHWKRHGRGDACKRQQTGTLFCTWASIVSLDGTDRSRLFSATQKSIGRAVSIPLCFHSIYKVFYLMCSVFSITDSSLPCKEFYLKALVHLGHVTGVVSACYHAKKIDLYMKSSYIFSKNIWKFIQYKHNHREVGICWVFHEGFHFTKQLHFFFFIWVLQESWVLGIKLNERRQQLSTLGHGGQEVLHMGKHMMRDSWCAGALQSSPGTDKIQMRGNGQQGFSGTNHKGVMTQEPVHINQLDRLNGNKANLREARFNDSTMWVHDL